jgi:hypothetical protein
MLLLYQNLSRRKYRNLNKGPSSPGRKHAPNRAEATPPEHTQIHPYTRLDLLKYVYVCMCVFPIMIDRQN